ncbi:MAG: prolyl oligopeptidase family serine peptidase [Alphaproteobacteria bacterium]|nr:prolyl oligopeptidase family serine peptidase [Alphaproteobacteria bacterium]
MRHWFLLATFAALLGAALAVTPAVAAFGPNDVIPRKIIFGNPERNMPVISPDGSRIAFLAPLNGVVNVWVAPADDLSSAKPVTQEKTRPIREFQWANDGTHLLYMQDEGGNENFHLFAVDLDKGTTKDLSPYKNTRAMIIAQSYERPDEILVGLNNRDPQWHDAWLINIATGEAKLVQKNDGIAGFVADHNLNIRLASKPTPDGGQEILQLDNGEWKPFARIPSDDALTTQPLFFTDDGATLVMLDSRGRDKAALTEVEMGDGRSSILAESDKADVAAAIADPVSMKVLAYAAEYDRTNWVALDSSVKNDIDFLNKQIPGVWQVVSQTKDNGIWTLRIDNITEPVKYGLYDRKAKSLKTLFTTRPSLEGAPLSPMYPRVLKSRDGLSLVSYLTLPRGADIDGNGVPDHPLPMVLDVHGGPWYRNSFGYNPEHQWLANRGYAVLSVNYRASTGFGKAFINAGDKEWARKMHNDLIDAVNWAVDHGIAQKDKIAIYGGSYGGYATLVGLTFTPKTFACGVDIVGPSNLNTLLKSIPAYWASFLDTLKRRVGDPTTPAGQRLLRERSPLFKANAIERPLLIAQGANDPRVKQAESDQIVHAMTAKGLPVTYVLYSDEGHGFARPENRLSFYAVSEAFLSQCLGGRFQPIGDDFHGSSIAVPVGKNNVPGLQEALAHP